MSTIDEVRAQLEVFDTELVRARGLLKGSLTQVGKTEGESAKLRALIDALDAPADPDPIPDPPPVDPNPGGVTFSAKWDSGRGGGDVAITDRGKFQHIYCSRTDVMEVVDGAPHGWVHGDVLQITNRGPEGCRNVECRTAAPIDADNYYVRAYTMVKGASAGGGVGHAVSMAVQGPFGAVYWGIGEIVTGSTYRPRMNIDPRVGMAQFGYEVRPPLNQNAWYRFEWHVEYFDPANPLRVRVWPFIYNMAETLVADASNYITNDWPNTASLADNYAAGGYGTVVSRDRGRWLQVGYEGNANNNDVGAKWYYAAVEVRTDRFPGPVAGGI